MATRTVTLARMNRWAILAGYGLLAASTQLLWLTYAPITTQTHRVMGVSTGAAGDLAAIFPLMYVVLALPSGRWLDAQFERALSAGSVSLYLGILAAVLSGGPLFDAGGLRLLLTVQALVAVVAAACCAWPDPPRTDGRWPGSSWWPLASRSC